MGKTLRTFDEIPQDAYIGKYDGKVVSDCADSITRDLEPGKVRPSVGLFRLNELLSIVPCHGKTYFMNHSYMEQKINVVAFVFECSTGTTIVFRAKRHIKVGEELIYNYDHDGTCSREELEHKTRLEVDVDRPHFQQKQIDPGDIVCSRTKTGANQYWCVDEPVFEQSEEVKVLSFASINEAMRYGNHPQGGLILTDQQSTISTSQLYARVHVKLSRQSTYNAEQWVHLTGLIHLDRNADLCVPLEDAHLLPRPEAKYANMVLFPAEGEMSYDKPYDSATAVVRIKHEDQPQPDCDQQGVVTARSMDVDSCLDETLLTQNNVTNGENNQIVFRQTIGTMHGDGLSTDTLPEETTLSKVPLSVDGTIMPEHESHGGYVRHQRTKGGRSQRQKGQKSKKRYVCKIDGCESSFATKVKYDIHIRRHRGEKRYFCGIDKCESGFVTKFELDVHKRRHTGKKQHVCGIDRCKRGFVTKFELDNHKRRHTGEKKYVCDIDGCESSFVSKPSLSSHKRRHRGEKRYACGFDGCQSSFVDKVDRDRHLRIHTGYRPHGCNISGCLQSFSSPSGLASHRRTHSSKKLYPCNFPGCLKSFRQKSTWKKHQRIHSDKVLANLQQIK